MKRAAPNNNLNVGATHKKLKSLGPAKLTDIANELATSVLLYLDFFDRSKARRACRRLKNLVDAMPLPGTTLNIRVVSNNAELAREREWQVIWDSSKSIVNLNVKHPLEVSSLLRLRTIRPTSLHVESATEEDIGVSVRLLHHLASDVGGTVTELSILGLERADALELQESFSKFDENNGPPVTKLVLSTKFPLVLAVSAVTRLRHLVTVGLTLRREMVPEWTEFRTRNELELVGFHLSALSSLPDLENLDIDIDFESLKDINCDSMPVVSFMLGCSFIPQLRRLSSGMFLEWDIETVNAFGAMLSRLKDLDELSLLHYPKEATWRKVHAVGGHGKLQKLGIYYSEADLEHLRALALACVQDFPSLVTLEIHFTNIRFPSGKEAAHALKELQNHPSLRKLDCGWDYPDNEKGNFFAECQELLGKRITVNEIAHVAEE